MRKARIIEEMSAYYHVVSRVVGREFVFSETDEREKFRKTLRAVEGFRCHYCGTRTVESVDSK